MQRETRNFDTIQMFIQDLNRYQDWCRYLKLVSNVSVRYGLFWNSNLPKSYLTFQISQRSARQPAWYALFNQTNFEVGTTVSCLATHTGTKRSIKEAEKSLFKRKSLLSKHDLEIYIAYCSFSLNGQLCIFCAGFCDTCWFGGWLMAFHEIFCSWTLAWTKRKRKCLLGKKILLPPSLMGGLLDTTLGKTHCLLDRERNMPHQKRIPLGQICITWHPVCSYITSYYHITE